MRIQEKELSGISYRYMELSILNKIKKNFETGEQDINTYSPLVLAYVGDAIYELVVRTILVSEKNEQVEKLHKEAINFVKAETQKNLIEALMQYLREDEEAVYKRARNSKQHTTPKNAKLSDYHKATGFEAVMGYLYLKGDEDRMLELIKLGLEKINEE